MDDITEFKTGMLIISREPSIILILKEGTQNNTAYAHYAYHRNKWELLSSIVKSYVSYMIQHAS